MIKELIIDYLTGESNTLIVAFMVADFSFSVLRLCKCSTRMRVLLVFIPAAAPISNAIFLGVL